MEETRAGKYGRNLALWIDYTISTIPKAHRKEYREKFLKELDTYSLMPRKSGQPANDGCVHELSDLMHVEITIPEDFARLVKEGIHLMYQKQTSARVLEALQKYLKPESLI
jgi:hypothetical protein